MMTGRQVKEEMKGRMNCELGVCARICKQGKVKKIHSLARCSCSVSFEKLRNETKERKMSPRQIKAWFKSKTFALFWMTYSDIVYEIGETVEPDLVGMKQCSKHRNFSLGKLILQEQQEVLCIICRSDSLLSFKVPQYPFGSFFKMSTIV